MDDTFKHLADNREKRDGSVVAWVCVTSFLKDWDDHGFLPSCRELAEFKTAVEKTCQTFRDSRSAKFKKGSWNIVKPSGFVCLEGGQDFVDFGWSSFEEGE